jgi:hypothetical protein
MTVISSANRTRLVLRFRSSRINAWKLSCADDIDTNRGATVRERSYEPYLCCCELEATRRKHSKEVCVDDVKHRQQNVNRDPSAPAERLSQSLTRECENALIQSHSCQTESGR